MTFVIRSQSLTQHAARIVVSSIPWYKTLNLPDHRQSQSSMLIGRAASCRTSTSWRYTTQKLLKQRQTRFISCAATPLAAQSSPSAFSVLAGLQNELNKLSPRFDIRASQIHIIRTPEQFYETVKGKILNAKSRIYLSTLYIGRSEHELIATIRQALANNPNLAVSFLTDALRGTRETPEPSCASLLVPLVAEFGSSRVEVRMYHTPNLTGLRKLFIPRRINEGWGLQHMKLYGFDDEVIISGANMSRDYFTNRQDRYHLISSKRVTDYFASIHKAVSRLSFDIQPETNAEGSYVMNWPNANPAPSPLKDPSGFIASAGTIMNQLIKPSAASQSHAAPTSDTTIYPLAQFTPLLRPDTSTEYPGLTTVLQTLSTGFPGCRWTFTAGYFNIQPALKSLLLASGCERGTVVTASPWANGFYGSKGISSLLPPAYSLLARRFLDSVRRAGREDEIELREWRRGTIGEPDGWTYHAKGLWVTAPGEDHPSITLVGSSNYTKRSYSLDLEMNLLVLTRDSDLQRRLAQEQHWLQEHARTVTIDDFSTPERRVGLHVRIAMWIVSLVGGAL